MRAVSAVAVIAAAAVILLSSGGAQTAAAALGSVTLQGQATVGSTLTAVVAATEPVATIEYRWQRCTGDKKGSCDRIQDAPNAPSYTVRDADLGKRLAVRAVTGAAGDVEREWSPLTDVVTAPPPPPPPTPTPTPTPQPTPTPDPDDPAEDPADDNPTFDQSGELANPPASAKVAEPGAESPPYVRPFPVVRVKGTLVPGGARITLLRVRAPSSAQVEVRCKGPGCRVLRRSFGAGRVRALERFLRAGTRITIRVSTGHAVGKYVRLVIRDGRAPKRRDACLFPGSTEPAVCPPA